MFEQYTLLYIAALSNSANELTSNTLKKHLHFHKVEFVSLILVCIIFWFIHSQRLWSYPLV